MRSKKNCVIFAGKQKHIPSEVGFPCLWPGPDSVDVILFFLFLDLAYSSQLYLLIHFLLKLPFVSFLSTIIVTKGLDSENKNNNIISNL